MRASNARFFVNFAYVLNKQPLAKIWPVARKHFLNNFHHIVVPEITYGYACSPISLNTIPFFSNKRIFSPLITFGGRVKRTASITGLSSLLYVTFCLKVTKNLKTSKFKDVCFNEANDELPALKH